MAKTTPESCFLPPINELEKAYDAIEEFMKNRGKKSQSCRQRVKPLILFFNLKIIKEKKI